MGIFNSIVNGASSQFGREFGRAAANSILKGKNSYTIESKSYDGRIKPSDSEVIKSIKEIKKVTFVSLDKGNISRLIEITNVLLSNIKFKGVSTLSEINDIKVLLELYNQKYEHGEAMISKDNNSQERLYLNKVREEFELKMDSFNSQLKEFVQTAQTRSLANKKSKSTTVILSFIFFFGLHNFYLGQIKKGVLSLIGLLIPFWNLYVLIKNIIEAFTLLFMSEEKFDLAYNTDYVYFNKFSFS